MPHPSADADRDLRTLVERNPGQGSFEEYRHLRGTIRGRAPCRLLIFGVGKDSRYWLDANADGTTVFVEHEPEWIRTTRERLPGVDVVQVTYDTRRTQWKALLERRDRKGRVAARAPGADGPVLVPPRRLPGVLASKLERPPRAGAASGRVA